MNKRLFKKYQIDLNVFKNSTDFKQYLNEIYLKYTNVKIIIIMDYHLENEIGTDVLEMINNYYKNKSNNIVYT